MEGPTCDTEKRRKIFLTTFINSFRVPALLDSGSDVIQNSLLTRLFKGKSVNVFQSNEPGLTSFSTHTISIKGKILLNLSFNNSGSIFSNEFYVINDLTDIPTLLLGNDFLHKFKGAVSYFTHNNVPKVTFRNPDLVHCDLAYENLHESRMCGATVNIKPQETLSVEMFLNPAADVLRNDYVLITSLSLDDVIIIPSRTVLSFCHTNIAFYGTACIKNISNQPYNGIIYGQWEIISGCDSVPLTGENNEQILSLMEKHPFSREI
jgi:hypothetical protein